MAQKLIIYLLSFYQKHVSGLLPPSCRFMPTCSEYTKQAINKYGFFKGGILGVKRLLCCHPLSKKSGYDPLI
ncbi:MAG: membrane protein insertion efficiency factor YidD [Candidatus Omnitrophota bacterium]